MMRRLLAILLAALLALGPAFALAEPNALDEIEAVEPAEDDLPEEEGYVLEAEEIEEDETGVPVGEGPLGLDGLLIEADPEDLPEEGEVVEGQDAPDLSVSLSDVLADLPPVVVPLPEDPEEAPVEPAPKAEETWQEEPADDAGIPDDRITLVVDEDALEDLDDGAEDAEIQDDGETSLPVNETPIVEDVQPQQPAGETDEPAEEKDENPADEPGDNIDGQDGEKADEPGDDADGQDETPADEPADEPGDDTDGQDGEPAGEAEGQGETPADEPADETDDDAEGQDGENADEPADDADGQGDTAEGEAEDAVEVPEVAEAPVPPETPPEVPENTITLSTTALTIGVGEKLSLTAKDSNTACKQIYWHSANAKLAKVTSAGKVTGVKVGTVVVTATNELGAKAECVVTVKAAPKKVKITPKTLNLGLKEKVQLRPKVNGAAACSTFKYASTDKRIVTVSKKGVVKGKAKGTATVKITSYNGKSYSLKVVVKKAATKVKLSTYSRMLGVGQTFTLTSKVKPANSAATVLYSTTNPAVATVNETTGKVFARGVGECDIIASTYFKKVKNTCHIVVRSAPKTISVEPTSVNLFMETSRVFQLGGKVKLAGVTPEEQVYADLIYSSSAPKVAAVDGSGKITGKKNGRAVITVSTYNGLKATVTVCVYKKPSKVTAPATLEILIGKTAQLKATLPAYSYPSTLTYASSNNSVAKVDANGLVTAGSKRGTCTITVRTANGKTAQTKVVVMDPNYPERASITKKPGVMDIGDTYQVAGVVVPSTANPKFKWASTNPSVAKVDSKGKVTALAFGTTTITATSTVNPAIKLSFTVQVWIKNLTLTVPARQTKLSSGVSAINANLKKIEAVRNSALWMVDWNRSKGKISAADAKKRKSIINNAFDDYAFPWITKSFQPYWRSQNSEGGRKNFKVGTVYYGMPYISGANGNRAYNRAKALSQKRYTSSGKGYYVLNKSRLLDHMYVGNDCSCFVDAAIWGTNSSHSYDRTTEIAKSNAYRTVSFSDLRPGDLICRGGRHVVMFLYYANPQRTKIMIIENGGAEKGVNTVHCSLYKLSWYTSRGYRARRLASLG